MSSVTKSKGPLSVRAHVGDAKTLLAFDLHKSAAKNLAGFTVRVSPPGVSPYYLLNELQFRTPADHAQVATLPANSSVNAPIHKFRWLHVPGSAHQGLKPVFGKYRYTVTPRYFDANRSLQPLDPALGLSIQVNVGPFVKKALAIGFTRGFTQSQAFVRHFGLKALIRPKNKQLLFDTKAESGVNARGEHYTYDQEYEWLGFTARERMVEILDEVAADKKLRLDVFAYDLNEPNLINALIRLAKQGRARVILDNAALHHGTPAKPEDRFEQLFRQSAKPPAAVLRGKFGRYSHDKVFVVSDAAGARKVLTGSTNFSVTGLYVNSNHVLVYDDRKVAAKYAEVFEESWSDEVAAGKFRKSPLSQTAFSFSSANVPATDVTFSPHEASFANSILDGLVRRIEKEGKKTKSVGSVLFAVMQMDVGTGPVFPALRTLHASESIFSYGISDSPGGIFLYRPGSTRGVLVTGKPVNTQLPPPFDQVPGVGFGHQIHHKFVVCGFNGPDPVVYCGSSNLAALGEGANGDNLLAIHDGDVATAFAIEALALVDHFDFLDRSSAPNSKKKASKAGAAVQAGWFLSTNDKWAARYYDPKDLRSVDRRLFA
ncbi:MAG TPA: phospholipase D-like domain-containing protein [Thermoanaerobaculia bacterium]|nr:phospholipase D-like domain-containing protein [Thermoanaerobaculia bacterium]